MKRRHQLEFHCQKCHSPITFSMLDQEETLLTCPECGKKYAFTDETLLRQLRKFESLCHQIHASEEILGSAAIAIDLDNQHVKVPFNILLTRLSSVIELAIGEEKQTIAFRIDPTKDLS